MMRNLRLWSYMAVAAAVFWSNGSRALELAEEMTCEQAIDYFEKNGVVYVFANGKFVVPLKKGTPVRQAGNLQCADRGSTLKPYTVTTKDVRRCVIALGC